MNAIVPTPFLRQALLSDGVTSGACAALLLGAAPVLEPMLGLPADLLRSAGLILAPFAVWVSVLGLRGTLGRAAVWAVIGANVVWTIDSLLLLASGWVQPTAAGYAFVLAQAAVVAMYAELQYIGLRRSQPMPA